MSYSRFGLVLSNIREVSIRCISGGIVLSGSIATTGTNLKEPLSLMSTSSELLGDFTEPPEGFIRRLREFMLQH